MTNQDQEKPVALSDAHIAAVNKPRRIVVNNDVGYPLESFDVTPEQWIKARFSLFDEPGSQVDSISWCLDEGNAACYPSKVLPMVMYPGLKKWLDAGFDVAGEMAEETHKRGLEAFWEYRLNGADREDDLKAVARLPMKEKHPDWLLKESWWGPGLWDFAVPGVRDYKVKILREVAENYDYDGLTIDFGRHPPALPVGEQWTHRDAMTEFIAGLRAMLQEVAAQRGRPFLLAVRVAGTPAGCHYDGLDIETWVRRNLVDFIIPGVRSTAPDVIGFRRLVSGTHIKLYPCIDDIHSTGGYFHPPIEFLRGLAANWWHQGADGFLTFNFSNESPDMAPLLGMKPFAPHQQAYHEIGDPKAIRFKDKMFVLQRRYGSGWDVLPSGWGVLPDPTKHLWDFYQNMNCEAPLPLPLPGDGSPAIESIYIADDVAGHGARVERAELRVQLSGVAAADVIEGKFNGVMLAPAPAEEDGWRVFSLAARHFAVGPNLIGLRWVPPTGEGNGPVVVEKVEVHVGYRE